MCLIIECKKDKPLSKELLQNMWKRNDDGWGMMWLQNNTLRVAKNPLKDFDLLWKKYNEVLDFDPIIHVRARTHGDIDYGNTHPFYCGFGIFMMHNGVLSIGEMPDKTKSDTWYFVERYIKPLFTRAKNPHKMIRNPKFAEHFGKLVGSYNRIIFGDRGGFVKINADQWCTITNPETKCEGLEVSNEYAWDAYSFGKKPKLTTTTYIGKPAQNQLFEDGGQKCFWDPEHQLWMNHIVGFVYEDKYHRRWFKSSVGNEYRRADHMDNVPITCAAGTFAAKVIPEVTVPASVPLPATVEMVKLRESNPTEWLEQLTKHYSTANYSDLYQFCYTQPGQAAVWMQHLVKKAAIIHV